MGRPSGGVISARRSRLQQWAVEDGCGVDIGLLLDTQRASAGMAEIDTGSLAHDSQPLLLDMDRAPSRRRASWSKWRLPAAMSKYRHSGCTTRPTTRPRAAAAPQPGLGPLTLAPVLRAQRAVLRAAAGAAVRLAARTCGAAAKSTTTRIGSWSDER